MSKSKVIRIGIIAEDNSDVDSLKILIKRISNMERIGFKKFAAKGCGKIKRKCLAWANDLKIKGCTHLILVHDLDRNELSKLREKLEDLISPCPISSYLICIPIEEMEAWFLSDPSAISQALKINKININNHPQKISSPKEEIGKLVKRASKGEKTYINTKHNSLIASLIDLNKILICDSYVPLHKFVIDNIAN